MGMRLHTPISQIKILSEAVSKTLDRQSMLQMSWLYVASALVSKNIAQTHSSVIDKRKHIVQPHVEKVPMGARSFSQQPKWTNRSTWNPRENHIKGPSSVVYWITLFVRNRKKLGSILGQKKPLTISPIMEAPKSELLVVLFQSPWAPKIIKQGDTAHWAGQ